MGRPEDEGVELGSYTNQQSRDAAKSEERVHLRLQQ